jgi:hypothetical protein
MNPTDRKLAKTIILTVVGATILSWGMLHFKVLAATVTASWTYDYGPLPACSEARPTDCIDHFEVEDITDQARPISIQSVNNPPLAVGKVDGVTTKFRYGPPFGQITFSVVAVKRERSGSFITSNPYAARATARISPGARLSLLF